jgi:dihydroflavonol-4-reductase
MNIFVIGAAGFLGNVLCRSLLKTAYTVTAADLNATSAVSLQDLPINKIDLDIRDIKRVEQLIQGHDVIIHLASLIRITKDTDNSMHEINVTGVKNVANAALMTGIKKFIYISSIHAFYRFPADKIIDENRELALSDDEFDYDKSKALGELALSDVISKGLNAIIISPTCFIGPYDYQPSLMGAAIHDFYHKKIIPYLNGGFNFVDVRDVAETIINAIDNGVSGERYIVGGEWLTIKKMIEMIHGVNHSKGIKIKIPTFLAYFSAYMNLLKWRLTHKEPAYSNQSLAHLKFHRFIDDTKARKILNHNPRPLTETFNDVFNWYYSK